MNSSRLTVKREYRLNKSEAIYLAGCFLVYLLWAVLFTDDRYGPDEVYRVLVPRFIYLNGSLPTGFEVSVMIDNWGFSYAYYMSLPYVAGALFMKLMSFFSTDPALLLIACRMSSVLSGLGTGVISVKIAKRISCSPLRWVFIVIMTFLPQMIFLSSYFNLDSFSLFTVMLIIYAWVLGIQSSWDRNSCIILAVGMGLCFLSYKFAWSYILCSFLLYVSWHAVNHKNISFKSFMLKGLMILGITFAICGWVFVRNYILYDGDFLALKQNAIYGELYAIDELKPSLHDTFKRRGQSIGEMICYTSWLKDTLKSFICGMGYMNIFPDWPYFYRLYQMLIAVSGLGVICFLFTGRSKGKVLSASGHILLWAMPFMMIASGITMLISVYYSWSTDYQSQGRYIISALPLFAALVSLGLDGLATACTKILGILHIRLKKDTLPRFAAARACLWTVISAFISYEALIRHFVHLTA